MKEKIEISQSDMVVLLKEKLDFLNKEYRLLYDAFKYNDRKNKTNVDTVALTTSYQRYLEESGDISRITKILEMFTDSTIKKTIKTVKPIKIDKDV